MRRTHRETHRTEHVGWLRAAVLGANDGIISIAGLVVGVAATGAGPGAVLGSGIAGIVAGAMSMAAGEYVSVQSQADTEAADIAKETRELAEEPEHELHELTHIYIGRGLTPELAAQVAKQLTSHDALASHLRDELGITDAVSYTHLDVYKRQILRDLYEGLVTEDAAGRLLPGMAERWDTSADGRTWTFHLREGLRWSNGEALDLSLIHI